MKKYLLLLFLLLVTSGCSNPLPESKLSYAGKWQSKEMVLVILADGSVAYERLKGGSTTTINAPIKEFVGDDFVVGVWFLTTTFEVSEPPHEVDGEWQMVVDEVRLFRTAE